LEFSKADKKEFGMEFNEIFQFFLMHNSTLKVISVASCDKEGKPNGAPKMLVDIMEPNAVFFLEYKFTRTYSNITENPQISLSFMDDPSFTGYRLTGTCEILTEGDEYEQTKIKWTERLGRYEVDRIIQRVKGLYSSKEAEENLPKDFEVIKVTAKEASIVKPDRVLRAINPKKKS
jgi:general stress protein 26